MLIQCHKELDGKKAAGTDKVTKAEYVLTAFEPVCAEKHNACHGIYELIFEDVPFFVH